MCGRYTMHHPLKQIEMHFGVNATKAETTERYNISPTQSVPVVLEHEGSRLLDSFQWGLIPVWAKDPGIGNKMINARAETLADKPAFKPALSRRRCLIPADGFYEWRKDGALKQPMYVRRKDGELFAFAGLWETWKQEDGSPLHTCTIITTSANDAMRPIHERMPVMLLPEDEALWLDVAGHGPADAMSVLAPYPSGLLDIYPVDRRVNVPTVDDPTLLNSL